jgi:LmbE family N-acetylglucosaminyl deacetylase
MLALTSAFEASRYTMFTHLLAKRRLTAITIAVLGPTLAACAPRSSGTSAGPRTLVAVFAHPDDETIVSPALAYYARQGVRVHLVVATDGRKGVSEHAGIPAGDSLATVRAAEARCSARELGAQPPIMLGFEDAGLAVLSPWPGEPLDRMAKRLETVLNELRPDAVITWGPEGGYGHQDHRLVGDVVTQVFHAGVVPPPARLFFVGFATDRAVNAPRWYGMRIYPTAPALLTAQVPFDERDRAAARRALGCHRSQATNGRVSFVQWGGGKRSSGLF